MIKKVKLRDICEVRGGYAFKSIDFQKQGIPVIRISNISDNSVLLDDKTVFVDSVSQDMLQKYSIHKGDILVALSGATTGKFGIYEEDTEALLNQRVAKLIPSNLINNLYLYYYLNTLRSIILQRAMGVAQPNISPKEIEDMIIFLPLLETQIKIVQILDQAQRLIDKRKEQIALLDDLIQSLFYDMFGDPVLNKKGWQTDLLGNKCNIFRGGSPRPIKDYLGGDIPWIKIGDATNGENIYLYDTKEKIIEEGVKKSRLVPKGSLIFANCGVSLGFARIIKFDGCIHDGWLSFESISNDINKIYLLKLLNLYTDYFRKTAPEGTQPNLNTKIMKDFKIIIPPIDLQVEYVNTILKMEQQKELLNKSLAELETNFHSLMQRAFRGELVVE